jgi:hypothetical protein
MAKSVKEKELSALKSHLSKLSNLIQDMTETVKQNKKLLRSTAMLDVTNYKSKLNEYRKVPINVDITVKIPELKTKVVQGRDIRIELGEYHAVLTHGVLSSLTGKVLNTLLDKAMKIASISMPVKPLLNVVCVGVDEAWVSGEDATIRRVDFHGTIRDIVNCQDIPNGIAVTRQGELVFSDIPNRTVNIVKHGETETLITTPQGWHPVGLFCTRSGETLVGMRTTDCSHYKIVRYQGHTVKQEIDTDENGQRIYKEGKGILWVMENDNGDICASDYNSKMVVVVDWSGKVRFRYDGTPATRKKAFIPEQLVTDFLNQIIVADYNNACLHILDQNGQFLRCVDNCGLDDPLGLSLDNKGRLWVGLHKSEVVKVIQYMK